MIGRIKKLEFSPDVQKRKIGTITVVYLDENDKRKTVTANLDKNDYDKAMKAHEKGCYVEIVMYFFQYQQTPAACLQPP